MKKVFFIFPPSPIMNREARCQQPVKDLMVIPPLPPLELMYFASIARELEFDCRIKDYSLNSLTLADLEADLAEYNPDYVVFNVATPTKNSDFAVSKVVKNVSKNIKTVAFGAIFLLEAKKALCDFSELDFVLKGEGELTLKELLSGKTYEEIKGLVYRSDEQVVENENREFIQNLDDIPFPSRDLVDNSLYRRPDNEKVQTLIKVARGCPFHCFFCLATPVSGAKVRYRSVENIIEEIKECVQRYNITNFVFWSDIFDLDRDWVFNLCDKLIKEDLTITWSSNTRVDTIDFELAKRMYDAGCRLVSVGFESGSQEILDKMGKKIDLERSGEAVRSLKKAKLKIYGYFVIGLPWENESNINQTIEFAKSIDIDFVSFYTATPLPGSRFYNYAKESGLIIEDECFTQDAYFVPTVPTHFLSREKVLELHKKAMKSFYLRPSYILKKIIGIKSLTELKNYIKAGLSLLFKK